MVATQDAENIGCFGVEIKMSLPVLYTPDEAAAKLKVTRRAIYQWLLSGRLKGFRVGQYWRISEDELLEFMKSAPATATNPKRSLGPQDRL
jgi:excisionase family DNA binding protein